MAKLKSKEPTAAATKSCPADNDLGSSIVVFEIEAADAYDGVSQRDMRLNCRCEDKVPRGQRV